MNFQEVKEKVLKEIGRDPFSDPRSWELIEQYLDKNLWPALYSRSVAAILAQKLPEQFTPEKILKNEDIISCWERLGNFFKNQNRFFEALSIYFALYYQLILTQKKTGQCIHKGMPLVWICDCYHALRFPIHSKRYLMLTLFEDAIRDKGRIPPDTTGTYWRAVYRHGLSDLEFNRYADQAYKLWSDNQNEALYPEWILQQIDKDWMRELPSPIEAGQYVCNPHFVDFLISKLGDKQGKTLEDLADYILSCMPGCRTTKRQKTQSTDLDIVCSMEGFEVDFRSELGRYFVCECKDWKKAADFSTVAKFCRVLDSIKAKFGILFSTHGMSGKGKNKDAELERLKIFQDRGMVIVVVDSGDFRKVSEGHNFINLLRIKYERVRLDIPKKNNLK
jgi:hypothetical protein